ncbi:MAG: phosphopyruvate hydratase, partial [Patescibacteria group bacterium]
PILLFNVINGGAHAPGGPDLQEYQVVPQVDNLPADRQVSESLRIGSEIYHKLKEIIKNEIGPMSANIGDEGGFVPAVKNNIEPFDLIMKAAKELGYENKIKIGIDAAGSEFYKDGKYILKEGEFDAEKLLEFYDDIVSKYPMSHIEDPFEEESFGDFAKITAKYGEKITVIGDDLTVTNIKKIQTAQDKKSCNGVIIKLNQIGTVWETLEAVRLAKSFGWKIIVSHRSGETEDTFISDLAFGSGADMIKTGAPCRGERVAKYNQLLRIEEELRR